MEKIRVDILGLSTSTSSGGAYALILRESGGQRRLPIIIGAFEAQAIALELEGIKPPRPMTHDLLKDIIERLGATLVEVVISELREGTFHAVLQLDTPAGGEIDSRPSDAIALAVRFAVPIYVDEAVMREAALVPEGEEEQDGEHAANHALHPREERITELKTKLDEAIGSEDYEQAARLRDEILRLEQGG